MNRLKRLIIEAHRRSLWQVLGVYVLSSWVVLQVADTLTGVFGLPHWVPQFALVLLIIGLPIVVATAVVQEGGPIPAAAEARADPGGTGAAEPEASSPIPSPSPERSLLQRHLTWKRALLGGVGAFALLGVLATSYLAAWALGIGPVGSLVAQGALEEGEPIILADFSPPTGDPALGAVVTDLLRVDLLETPILRVVEQSEIGDVLARMQTGEVEALTGDLAREVAIREGIAAVLEGEVARAGTGYVLTATLRHAESGRSLAAFRETARSDDEVIPAIERLSRRIRERAGESLRSVHQSPAMEQVTTSSLEALRLYSRAVRASDRGDHRGAISLLEEAVEVDPDFAMAWRLLAVTLYNSRTDPARQREAAIRAFELRDRLTTRERHLTTAYYHREVTQDLEAEIEAYRRVLELDPDDRVGLNNLALAYGARRDFDRAAELLSRLVQGPGASPTSFVNLIATRLRAGQVEEARRAQGLAVSQFPEDPDPPIFRSWIFFYEGKAERAGRELEGILAAGEARPAYLVFTQELLAVLALWEGRLGEARERFGEAQRMAEAVDPSLHWGQRLFEARAEVAAGAPERAVEMILRAHGSDALEAVPLEGRQYGLQGVLLAAAGDPTAAEAVLRRWEQDVPSDARGRVEQIEMDVVRSLILLSRGQAESAVETLTRARGEMRCGTCWEWAMAWALEEAGRPRDAAAEWETATLPTVGYPMEHIPIKLWAIRKLGPLYEELGDTERALHHYRRLVELWADADPELQPVVERARERIRALEGSAELGETP